MYAYVPCMLNGQEGQTIVSHQVDAGNVTQVF